MTRPDHRPEHPLDQLIAHARDATVDRAAAERYVGELDRWARPAAAPARRWAWLTGGIGVGLAAATAVLLMIGWPGGAGSELSPVQQIGAQVAVVAEADSLYHVVHAEHDATEIAVERGTVTARLWPGEHRHHLTLSGHGVSATAIGTVYSFAIRAGRAVVHVVEGTVEVHAPDGVHILHRDETWPPEAARAAQASASNAAGHMLLLAAPPAPELAALADDAGIPTAADASSAGADAGEDAASEAAAPLALHPAPGAPPAAPLAVKDRWRDARLLRGQGKFAAALAACIAIGDARDATWSPIALVEAVRIALGPLADPERAITLADRMTREWPSDPLASEARALRCRALEQLGRGSECTTAAHPR